MKISREQIQRIVKEEAKRELPISYYSDEMLMQEGLLDFLKSLFGPLVDFFKDAWGEAQKKAVAAYDTVEGDIKTAAEKLGVKGVESTEDLDMEKKDHQKIFYAAVAPTELKWGDKDKAAMEQAATVKDWTPKSDSDEDIKAWEAENGEAAQALWSQAGNLAGSLGYYGEMGISSAAEASAAFEAVGKSANPGEAVQWMISGFEEMKKIYEFAGTLGIKAAKDVVAMNVGLAGMAKELGQKIAASGKEQQQESLELRKMINHMIIQERKIIKGNSGR